MHHRLLILLAAVSCAPAPATASATPRKPIVAVLDSGADLRHPDLRGALWRNPGEIAGNRLDDDGNGYVDDVHGADIVGRDGSPRDPRGHGTHVAGIIAGRGGARIMPVRVIGRDGRGWTHDLAAGIDYALAEGARVINLSLSGYGHDPRVSAALDRAAAVGALVVVAAGNQRQNLDRTPVYPASYRTPGMVVVAAARRDGRLASWSARGLHSVDLAAPGIGVRSALPGRRRGRMSGTSQAAARVSRAAARALSVQPRLSASELRSLLLGKTSPAGGLARTVVSGGRLNLHGILAALRP